MSTVTEVAQGLIDLCRQGKFLEAINAHYADDIVSVEPVEGPGHPAEMSGIEAIRGKTQWWAENHKVHELKIGGPYVGEEQFAVYFEMDITPKMTGKRMTMREMGLYTVKDGKISREEFYYNMPGA